MARLPSVLPDPAAVATKPADAERAAGPSRGQFLEAVAVGIAAVVVLAARAPFAMHRLWAEDGKIFLQQPINDGIVRSFGKAYAGYYLFVPRVIGAAASAVPLRRAAFTTWLGAAAVVGWCAATIYAESRSWLDTRVSRALLAFSVVLLPSLGFEAIANTSTVQFTMLFASLVALTGTSTTRGSTANRCAMLALTGLTTPLALTLAPIAVARVLLLRRPRRLDATTVAWGVAIVVQFAMILIGRPGRNVGTPGNKAQIPSYYVHQVLYPNLLPKQLATRGVAPLLVLPIVALVVAAAWHAWRRGERDRAVLLLLVPLTGFAFWAFVSASSGAAARYVVLPACCFIWSVLLACEEILRAISRRRPVAWRAMSIVLVILLLSWTTYWKPSVLRSSGPRWSAALAFAYQQCQHQSQSSSVAVAISPGGHLPGLWTVKLPCHDLPRP
jgi:hypothetical protein